MVEQELFIQWAEERFDKIKVSGNEVKIPDIWHSHIDKDNKCWVNTEKGCFRAFKSERAGNIFELVMDVDGCSWDEAKEKLGSQTLKDLENRVAEFLKKKPQTKNNKTNKINLPPSTYLLKSLNPENPARMAAEKYLKERNLSISNLMICVNGKWNNRIIIPYYSEEGELIYFNGRDITGKSKIKYLGPSKESGVGKGDVLWMSTWPIEGSKVYVTEGEFDAMSLKECGFHSAACGGKNLSSKQIEMLRKYHVIMCYDSDEAGKDGLRIAYNLIKKGLKKVGYIRPPIGYKDWNDLFKETKPAIVKAYIDREEKEFNPYIFNANSIEEVI